DRFPHLAGPAGHGPSGQATTPGLGLSVNFSGRQLSQRNIVDVVERALGDAGLPADSLTLEITESVLMSDARQAVEVVRALAALGVRFSIDDFGTGYSSLAYLKRFSAHVLKIDRSFIDGLGRDAQDSAIVDATIALARALGIGTAVAGQPPRCRLDPLPGRRPALLAHSGPRIAHERLRSYVGRRSAVLQSIRPLSRRRGVCIIEPLMYEQLKERS